MKRSFLKFLPFFAMASMMSRTNGAAPQDVPQTMSKASYGAIGYSGFVGTNANKPKHFNKKRHGRALRRKHAKSNL